jgi:hypothetical protein
MKRILFVAVFIFSFELLESQQLPLPPETVTTSCKPQNGFVATSNVASKIAEAVWIEIYGLEVLKHKPYKIKLKNGIWIISGSISKGSLGGVPYIEIQKKDGKIIKVSHSK